MSLPLDRSAYFRYDSSITMLANFSVFSLLSEQFRFFPVAAFFALTLAGFNIPISEDAVIITGAMLTRDEPAMGPLNLACIYAGVFLSDCISFWLGVWLRKGIQTGKVSQDAVKSYKTEKFRRLLEKYGALAFIVCRFIPFGIRNALFISSGALGLRFRRFILFDIPASLISVNTLFFLVYCFGGLIEKPFRVVEKYLFAAFVAALAAALVVFVFRWRRFRKK